MSDRHTQIETAWDRAPEYQSAELRAAVRRELGNVAAAPSVEEAERRIGAGHDRLQRLATREANARRIPLVHAEANRVFTDHPGLSAPGGFHAVATALRGIAEAETLADANRIFADTRAKLDTLHAAQQRPQPRERAPRRPRTPAADKAKKPANVRFVDTGVKGTDAKAVFGTNVLTDAKKPTLAAAANAHDGASVNVRASRHNGKPSLDVDTRGDGYYASRSMFKDSEGKLRIHNNYFRIDYVQDPTNLGPPTGTKPKGWKRKNPEIDGSALLANQVKAARELGVNIIETHAARSDSSNPNSAMVGFYTWPRLGYDGPIPERHLDQLPPALKAQVAANPTGSKIGNSILDLMHTKEGRDWWQKNGSDIYHCELDLTPGSLSMRVHDAYLAEQAADAARQRR